MKKILKWLFTPTKSVSAPRKEYSKLIWCSDCGRFERIYFPKMDITTTIHEWLFDYRIPQNWQMVKVGLQLHFLCPNCIKKRKIWGQQFL